MYQLQSVDPEIAQLICEEEMRQKSKLELIASENFVSAAVREAQGSVLTNKYAEGYPGRPLLRRLRVRRYRREDSPSERARSRCSGRSYANVQPHAGAQANTAVYFAFLQAGRRHPGDEPQPTADI